MIAPFTHIPNYILYIKVCDVFSLDSTTFFFFDTTHDFQQMIEASPTREQLKDYKFFNVEEFFRILNVEKELMESLRRLQKNLDAIQERSTDVFVTSLSI